MHIVDREDQQRIEHEMLSECAAYSDETYGRSSSAEPDMLRNDYQRDRDKILHSKSFRRLSHKTQVFLSVEGDHYRTRLTHTLEVSQIARTVARALALNEDLTEAIALGHDLGHTPFGHLGERALRESIAKHRGIDPMSAESMRLFNHNEQSLRVVEVIENNGQGLNLTAEVRDGIICHTGSQEAETMEGRIVAIADRIAYVNHDIDDAIRANMLKESELPDSTHAILGPDHSSRIQTLVQDMVMTSSESDGIYMSDDVWNAMMELRGFLQERIYCSDAVLAEGYKAGRLISAMFDYYLAHIEEVPSEYIAISQGDDVRAVTDYIASMTDRYATSRFRQLFEPESIEF